MGGKVKRVLSLFAIVLLAAGCAVWHGEVSRDEATGIAFEVCRNEGWGCKDFEIENRITQWVLISTGLPGAKRAYIHVDKASGKITSKVWGVRDTDSTVSTE
jgi:hypothetical protein